MIKLQKVQNENLRSTLSIYKATHSCPGKRIQIDPYLEIVALKHQGEQLGLPTEGTFLEDSTPDNLRVKI